MSTIISSPAIAQAIRNLRLFGVVACPSPDYRPGTPPGPRARFGVHTTLYGSPADAWALCYNDAGVITSYAPLGAIARHKYHPSIAHTPVPAVGEPYDLGMVLSAYTPEVPVILGWHKAAATMTDPAVYPIVREAVIRSGLAGYTAARFLGHRVAEHADNGSTLFAAAAAEGAIWQMQQIEDAMGAMHPEWVPKGPATAWACSLANP